MDRFATAVVLVSLGLALGVGCKGARSPADHCAARQAFWERGFDPKGEDVKAREIFVGSCTEELSKPGADGELRCRDRCLDEATKDAPPGSEAAKAAYTAFAACERGCLD